MNRLGCNLQRKLSLILCSVSMSLMVICGLLNSNLLYYPHHGGCMIMGFGTLSFVIGVVVAAFQSVHRLRFCIMGIMALPLTIWLFIIDDASRFNDIIFNLECFQRIYWGPTLSIISLYCFVPLVFTILFIIGIEMMLWWMYREMLMSRPVCIIAMTILGIGIPTAIYDAIGYDLYVFFRPVPGYVSCVVALANVFHNQRNHY